MIAKASLRYIRISPRKFRQIIPLIKGKRAEQAAWMLASVKKRASAYAIDLLKSAIANAKRAQQGIDTADLYISNLLVSGGPMLKRYRAASMGRAVMIRKRTSHVTVVLDLVKKPEGETAAPKAKGHVEEKATGGDVKKSSPKFSKSENFGRRVKRLKAEEAAKPEGRKVRTGR